MTLAGGEEFNGIELWRSWFVENIGGSIEMQKNERAYFINFPKCTRDEDLQAHLNQWKQLSLKYGVGLPDDHLGQMFHDILPEHILKEVKSQRDLVTLNQQFNWVISELSRFNDHRLSKWNMLKLAQQLKPGPKTPTAINPLMADGAPADVPSSDVQAPPVPDMASVEANVERMVAAAFSKQQERGRRDVRTPTGSRSGTPTRRSSIPSPKFEGCWCCGKKGHSRQHCEVFKAIKAKNGGKVPKDYEGAYEKSMKTSSAKVSAIVAEPAVARTVEHPETFMWPLITTKGTIQRPPRKSTTPVENRYGALTDDDAHDDDE